MYIHVVNSFFPPSPPHDSYVDHDIPGFSCDDVRRRGGGRNIHVWSVVGLNPTRGSTFVFGKVTALGVLCCFALLFLWLLSFFLPSSSSLIKTCIQDAFQDAHKRGEKV